MFFVCLSGTCHTETTVHKTMPKAPCPTAPDAQATDKGPAKAPRRDRVGTKPLGAEGTTPGRHHDQASGIASQTRRPAHPQTGTTRTESAQTPWPARQQGTLRRHGCSSGPQGFATFCSAHAPELCNILFLHCSFSAIHPVCVQHFLHSPGLCATFGPCSAGSCTAVFCSCAAVFCFVALQFLHCSF